MYLKITLKANERENRALICEFKHYSYIRIHFPLKDNGNK